MEISFLQLHLGTYLLSDMDVSGSHTTLDFVSIHWIPSIQWKSFMKNTNIHLPSLISFRKFQSCMIKTLLHFWTWLCAQNNGVSLMVTVALSLVLILSLCTQHCIYLKIGSVSVCLSKWTDRLNSIKIRLCVCRFLFDYSRRRNRDWDICTGKPLTRVSHFDCFFHLPVNSWTSSTHYVSTQPRTFFQQWKQRDGSYALTAAE